MSASSRCDSASRIEGIGINVLLMDSCRLRISVANGRYPHLTGNADACADMADFGERTQALSEDACFAGRMRRGQGQ
jgi:hypothetical protein